MGMTAHQLLAFDADGSITQGRSLGGAGNDTNVLGHGPIVAGPSDAEARATLRRIMQRDLDKMRRRPFFFPLVLPVLLFIAVVLFVPEGAYPRLRRALGRRRAGPAR